MSKRARRWLLLALAGLAALGAGFGIGAFGAAAYLTVFPEPAITSVPRPPRPVTSHPGTVHPVISAAPAPYLPPSPQPSADVPPPARIPPPPPRSASGPPPPPPPSSAPATSFSPPPAPTVPPESSLGTPDIGGSPP